MQRWYVICLQIIKSCYDLIDPSKIWGMLHNLGTEGHNVPPLPGPRADIENKLVITRKIKLSEWQLSWARPCSVWDRTMPVTIWLSYGAKFSQIISAGVTSPSVKMLRVFAVLLIFSVSSSNPERNFYKISELRGTYEDIQEDYNGLPELEDSNPTRERRSSFYRFLFSWFEKLKWID